MTRTYSIEKEQLVKAAGRYYRVITAVPGEQVLSEAQRVLGVNVTGTATANLLDYYRWQLEIANTWRSERGTVYQACLKEAISELEANHG